MEEYINKSDVSGLVRIGWSGDAIVTAIINDGISSVPAIPIPEGATNGDVIKAMFPNELLTSITSTLWWGDNMSFNKDWWNAPYKGNLSEKPTGSESEEKEWVMKIGL